MNPETEPATTQATPSKSPRISKSESASSPSMRKSQVFQRRLKEKICESRALELLDRKIKHERNASPEQVPLDKANSNQDTEEELVCDSIMVRFEASLAQEDRDLRVAGVLKTVRGIHRQRARERPENQAL